MLKFLETFDRRSWRAVGDIPFLVPLPKDDMRAQPAYVTGEDRD